MIVPLLAAALFQTPLPGHDLRTSGDPSPDTVLIASAGSLQERWAWAERAVRGRFDAFWVGWTVSGDPTGGQWYYIDRGAPVNVGSSVIVGSLTVSGSFGGIRFSGVPLGGLVPARDPHETAVLLRYEVSDGRARLTRVYAGSFAFPVHFDGGALVWLGEGDDAGSVALLRGAWADAADEGERRDLVAAVSAHTGPAALPALSGWLANGDIPASVRRTAAEGLARPGSRDAVSALMAAMREDSSASVRSAAARALARAAEPASAIAALRRLADEDPDRGVRRNAVSAIGSIRDPAAFEALVAIIEAPVDTTRTTTRRSALSALVADARAPSTPASPEVLELIERIAFNDAEGSVRQQAVSSMASLRDPRLTPVLIRIAGTHPDAGTRRAATSALARVEPRADAVEALERIAMSHESADTQRAAVSALSRMDGDDVRAILARLAEDHPRSDIRRSALRAVIELDARDGGTVR